MPQAAAGSGKTLVVAKNRLLWQAAQ